MEVDDSPKNDNSTLNGSGSQQLNGLTNGYPEKHKSHKSDHKDKHREKDRDKHRSKDHKSSSKDKERHSSKDKDRHSSSHKSSRSDKEKDKHRDKDKHREEKKSSSSKDKEHKSSREKEHKSSSSKDKEREEKRDKYDKDKHNSSRDKHSSSKDKHRDKEKSHSKDKERKREKESNAHHKVKVDVKPDTDSAREDSLDEDEPKLVIKEDSRSQSESELNASAASSCDYNLSQFKDEPKEELEEEEEEYQPQESQSSDEDIPLANRSKRKIKSEDEEEDEDDDVPLSSRKKVKKEKKVKSEKKGKKRPLSDDDDEYEEKKVIKKEKKKKIKEEVTIESPKKGKKKKEEEQQEVWKWWEEEKKNDGTKWTFLEHKGPVFAPPYERLPDNVKFYYNGKHITLSEEAEEVAGFYAKMLDHDYTTKKIFNDNFFKDWRKVMTQKEQSVITNLEKCNFKDMHAYFMEVAEKNRNRTKEEKLALKTKNEEIIKEYGFCKIDGHTEKIGNFKIEPPGLFRGRGEHPKMGKLKKRVIAEDIIINCSKDAKVPSPPKGHKWREVRHDPAVTWLASWTENVQNQVKYVMLNPSSKLKGEKDWQKYETARKLHKSINKIREQYKDGWKSKEMRIRQRAVALYFIDKLALRAGNEKDEDQADTVGCCSLRVEHIELHKEKDDKENVVVFDFLGKDSIRYYNEVSVEKRVFKNLQLFMENKKDGDDLFDRLNTSILNKHLNELMDGLTAKVFRTYNASYTLQQQLDKLTNEDDSISEKILSYNRANRAVAILCNHQRAVPKGHQKSMEKLKEKIDTKKDLIKDAERQVKDAQRDAKHGSVKEKTVYEKKKKMLQRMKEQLAKLEIQETDRDENKTIALGTSKLNYLDPRISVAWCKKYDVPIEKIYNKTQRDKFRWAIDMAGPDYRF
uniref:DNA topoisomerase I n=1 Tax=Photinus pyralis TaxID=7054 RepID=A0A1Y1N6M1_PHOPY